MSLSRTTAVLLSWQRQYNIPLIVRSLENYRFINEVIIWNNAPEPDGLTAVKSDRFPVRLISEGRNVCTYGRFLAAKKAEYDVIYTQDDDIIVNNIDELYRSFQDTIADRAITAGLSHNHYILEAHKQPWLLLGWGSFFLRDWIGILDRWVAEYGVDNLLLRKADRIFTILHSRHNPQRGDYTPLKGPGGVDSERDNNALWLRRDHWKLTQLAADLALKLKTKMAADIAGADQCADTD